MHGDGAARPPPASEPAPAPPEPVVWTRQQDKLLELLLCRMYPRWDRIAEHLGSDKTPEQAWQRYDRTAAELRRLLEAPEVETPPEWDLQETTTRAVVGGGEATVAVADDGVASAIPAGGAGALQASGGAVREDVGAPARSVRRKALKVTENKRKRGGKRRRPVLQRKRSKAVPWSLDEHNLFLAGIRKYGKGMWQRLSCEFVRTRSPTQIASHYQKYAIRQEMIRLNKCKRPSIHDINDAASVPANDTGHHSAAAGENEVPICTDELSALEDEQGALVMPTQDRR